jgi:hypothetical protein
MNLVPPIFHYASFIADGLFQMIKEPSILSSTHRSKEKRKMGVLVIVDKS